MTYVELCTLLITQFTYDLRDRTEDTAPWVPPVQPLTRLQSRFRYLLEHREKSERKPWRQMKQPEDDFEYYMKEMVDGTATGKEWAHQLIRWYQQHMTSPHITECRNNQWRYPGHQDSPIPQLQAWNPVAFREMGFGKCIDERWKRRLKMAPLKPEGAEIFDDYVHSMPFPNDISMPPPPPPSDDQGGGGSSSGGGRRPPPPPPRPNAEAPSSSSGAPPASGSSGSTPEGGTAKGHGSVAAPSAPGPATSVADSMRGSAGQASALSLVLRSAGAHQREASADSAASSVGAGPGRKGDPPPQPAGMMAGALHSYLEPVRMSQAVPPGFVEYETAHGFQRHSKDKAGYLAKMTCVPCGPTDDNLAGSLEGE